MFCCKNLNCFVNDCFKNLSKFDATAFEVLGPILNVRS